MPDDSIQVHLDGSPVEHKTICRKCPVKWKCTRKSFQKGDGCCFGAWEEFCNNTKCPYEKECMAVTEAGEGILPVIEETNG